MEEARALARTGMKKHLRVLPMYAGLPSFEQMKVFERVSRSVRKVRLISWPPSVCSCLSVSLSCVLEGLHVMNCAYSQVYSVYSVQCTVCTVCPDQIRVINISSPVTLCRVWNLELPPSVCPWSMCWVTMNHSHRSVCIVLGPCSYLFLLCCRLSKLPSPPISHSLWLSLFWVQIKFGKIFFF